MPGAEGWLLLLLLLPAPRCSNAFSPCVLLLPSAPESQTPTPCPRRGRDLSSGHDHHFGNFPRAAVQQLYSHAAQAAGDAGGRRVGGAAGTPGDPCHRHPAELGQADPSWGCSGCKGEELPLLLPCSVLGRAARGWGSPYPGPDLSRGASPEPGGMGVDHSSPNVTTLTCAFCFTCSRAWERGSCLSPAPLTSEQKHPQGPHHTQEALAAAPPQVISH